MIKVKQFFTAKYDIVFKNVIMKEPRILKRMLEEILNEKIDELTILNNDLLSENIDCKGKIVDALIKIKDKYINIEVNSTLKKYTHDRNLLYVSNILSQNSKKGKNYNVISKVIQINLTWGINKNRPFDICKLRNKRGELFSDKMVIIRNIYGLL